ncbi:Glutathione gamma-glutamylcysteinyltransferase 1 [Trebouxia sp. C0010 RCD-2024]
MVLNALSIDPRRAWKGPWRWFHEQMLDCCEPLSQVLQTGIVLDQAACLARCNGAQAEMCRYGDFTEDSFRSTVQHVCCSEQQHLIVSYSRKEFLQTGDGHFSPVGGYHAESDMVLILDTARFKYPPHWVPLKGLYQAMAHVDSATSQPRGFLKIRANPRLESVMFTLNQPNRAWHNIKAFMDTQLPALIQQQPQTHPQDQAAPREDSTGPFAQAVHTTDTTAHLAARQNQEHSTVVRALLPVVKSLPKDSVLQVMSVRSGSPAGCCNSGAAARQAASAEWVTQATAKQAPAAKSANEVVAADVATEAESTAAPTAAEAACVPQAAAHLFLTELHSTELFHVVGYCLSQAQRTAGHVLHRGQAEPDRLSGAAVSWETTAAFESTEVPKSSSVWHDLNVISGLGKSAAEMVLDKSAQHVSQQQLDDMHSTLCIVQEQQLSSAAVPTLGSSQTVPLVLGSSSHQDSDCSAPQKTAGDPTSPLSDMLTEMICMLLLLLPRTAWHCACDEVRLSILQVLDMSAYSVVASEADYLAAQWAELPQLLRLKAVGSPNCS